jgi:hypothetical protein
VNVSKKTLEDILIEIPTGELNLKGLDIGPKHRRRIPDRSRFDYRETWGMDWSETLCRFVSKHQIIDRENNRYFELVVDDESGEILIWCQERLSDHKNHGSAKKSSGSP